jgi:N-acetylglutamate synthase-like GNAT family acetyltransferase
MTMEYLLRQFKKDDAKGVKDLILSILAKEYPFDKSAYSDSDLDKIGEVYGGERESFFVIEEGGQIVATTGIKKDSNDEALLRRFFVDSKHRKRGYGTQLLDKVMAFCKENGYKKIYFRCTDRMLDAMNLCLKKGFREVEKLEVSGFKIHRLVLDI